MGWMAVDRSRAARAALLACALVLVACVPAALAQASAHDVARATPLTAQGDGSGYSVTLKQCVSSSVPSERSVTFVAQMTATAGTQKMAMKIELEQRLRGEADYHRVVAPGLGSWSGSEAGVTIYKYVKQVTNLTAPASYRAFVRFRWIGDKGKVIKRAELRSPRCFQPALPPPMTPPAAG